MTVSMGVLGRKVRIPRISKVVVLHSAVSHLVVRRRVNHYLATRGVLGHPIILSLMGGVSAVLLSCYGACDFNKNDGNGGRDSSGSRLRPFPFRMVSRYESFHRFCRRVYGFSSITRLGSSV